MSDFIREVDEDYRRDRTIAFLKRWQVPIALAIVGIVVGAGGWRWWQDQKIAAAERENARFVAAADLAKDGKAGEAAAAFDALAKDAPVGYASLARMRAAQAEAAADPEAAAKAYDMIATDTSLPSSLRDIALIRGAFLRVDRLDPKAFENRYGRYALPGFGFHDSMRELLALAALKRGDMEGADRYLDDIIADPSAPSPLRNRAEAFRALAASGPAVAMTTQPGPAQVTPPDAPPPQATPAAAPTAPAAAPPPTFTLPGASPPAPTPAPPPAASPPAPAAPPAPATPH